MRSWLFVPCDNEKMVAKALASQTLASQADVTILDLEDSVAPDNKALARQILTATLANRPATSSKIYVRVNPLDSGLTKQDIQAAIQNPPDGFMLPKTDHGKDVKTFAKLLDTPLPIIAIATETAASLFNLGTYANLKANLHAMTWGAEDLSNALGATTAHDQNGALTSPYIMARNLCLAGARAAGVEPIDSVYTNFRDPEGLSKECAEAARDGFTGKMAIHPNQIDIINSAFTPSQNDIETANKIVQAFKTSGNKGVISLDGKMYDIPHLKRAENLLKRAQFYQT